MKWNDYYQILGVEPSANEQEIKRSFRRLCYEWHPDINKNPEAHEKFIEISSAYLILNDAEARKKYDSEYYRHKPNNCEKNEFEDADLKTWCNNAHEQSVEFAKMSFQIFIRKVKDVSSETGFQLGNTLAVFLGLLLGIRGCNGIRSCFHNYNIDSLILSIFLLIIGGGIISFCLGFWEKHNAKH